MELGTFLNSLDHLYAAMNIAPPIDERDFPRDQSIPRMQRIRWLRNQLAQQANQRRPSVASTINDQEDDEDVGGNDTIHEADEGQNQPSRLQGQPQAIAGRLSITSYTNDSIDPVTGKWVPRKTWTLKHDQLYAKLCFSVLLFKSPRKSNYVVADGETWYVNWQSGQKMRVLPPAYGHQEPIEPLGPWQVYMPENTRI